MVLLTFFVSLPLYLLVQPLKTSTSANGTTIDESTTRCVWKSERSNDRLHVQPCQGFVASSLWRDQWLSLRGLGQWHRSGGHSFVWTQCLYCMGHLPKFVSRTKHDGHCSVPKKPACKIAWKLSTGPLKMRPLPIIALIWPFHKMPLSMPCPRRETYSEAYRITHPGGALVFCDLMSGSDPDVSEEELLRFSKSNAVNDWLTPEENVKACQEAGWRDVHWIDLTTDIRISFQRMLKKVTFVLEHGDMRNNSNRVLLMNYRDSICKRITQIDRGLFKWAVIHARKPVYMELACKPPVPFVNTNHLISKNKDDNNVWKEHGCRWYSDQDAQRERSRHFLTQSSSSLPCQLGSTTSIWMLVPPRVLKSSSLVAMPSPSTWYSTHSAFSFWDCAMHWPDECPFSCLGMESQLELRGKPSDGLYHRYCWTGSDCQAADWRNPQDCSWHPHCILRPGTMKDVDAEEKFDLEYVPNLEDLATMCDVLLPLCPLTQHTKGILSCMVLSKLKPHAGFINIARGAIVDHEALTEALETKAIKYALLDTTFPEPLPTDHRLWKIENCFIFPHFTPPTRWMFVRLLSMRFNPLSKACHLMLEQEIDCAQHCTIWCKVR